MERDGTEESQVETTRKKFIIRVVTHEYPNRKFVIFLQHRCCNEYVGQARMSIGVSIVWKISLVRKPSNVRGRIKSVFQPEFNTLKSAVRHAGPRLVGRGKGEQLALDREQLILSIMVI